MGEGSEVVSTLQSTPPLYGKWLSVKRCWLPIGACSLTAVKKTSGSKLQRIFWLIMNGPLSEVSTKTSVISCLSHLVSHTCIFITHRKTASCQLMFLRLRDGWSVLHSGGFLFQTRHRLIQCHFISPKTLTRRITTTLTQHNRHCVNISSAPSLLILSLCSSDVFH